MAKPVLYSYFRSAASWRVRIALAYKGIEYDIKPVHLVKDGGQQHLDEYVAMNPMHQVPTLIIDGQSFSQSLPIIEYLDETRPTNKLLPDDPVKRQQARSIAEMVNSGVQPLQNLSVLQAIAQWTGDDAKKAEWGKYWVHRGFVAIEKVLGQTSGRFCVGDDVTIADVCLLPQLHNAERFKVDMSEFPTIVRVTDELAKLDAFQKAQPFVQPDCPEDLRIK